MDDDLYEGLPNASCTLDSSFAACASLGKIERLRIGLCACSVPTAMLAGALAGISEHSVMFPVDAIKVTSQNTLSGRTR